MILEMIMIKDIEDMYQKKNMAVIVNDGKIVGFEPAE